MGRLTQTISYLNISPKELNRDWIDSHMTKIDIPNRPSKPKIDKKTPLEEYYQKIEKYKLDLINYNSNKYIILRKKWRNIKK